MNFRVFGQNWVGFCSIVTSILVGQSGFAAVEYGMFEKTSDGRFQSVCPVQADGSMVCRYQMGSQTAQQKIGSVELAIHQQNLKALESLTVIPFGDYDEAIRKLIPQQNFLFNGYYVKFEAKTVLIDVAHFYSPVAVQVNPQVREVIVALIKTLSPLYYASLQLPNPLIKKMNRCPVLAGRFDCGRNTLLVTQKNFGVDEVYVFTYSDRTAPFDFGANDAGMKNATDKFLAQCSPEGLRLDTQLMRISGFNKDLEFTNGMGGSPVVCRRTVSAF